MIKKQVGKLSSLEGWFSTLGAWKIKSKVCPKDRDPPMAKLDESGNLITAPENLKNLYINTYVHRLKSREISPGLLKLRALKEKLWQKRNELAKKNKIPDWCMKDLENVLKLLKKNKARDPNPLQWLC